MYSWILPLVPPGETKMIEQQIKRLWRSTDPFYFVENIVWITLV